MSGSVAQFLADSAASTPDAIALRAGDEAWTFHELDDWSRQLAQGLLDAGAQPGDRIAFFMPNCGELVAGYFACFAAGLVALPLNHRYLAAEGAVRSDARFDRYWNNPEATGESLRDGWLYTGDLGRFDADGWLWFMGRAKQIIIRAGSNIVPEEVEEVLYQHPAVRLACIVGAADEHLGQRVEGFVELEPDVSPAPTGDDLRAFVADRIASYKVPEQLFVLPAMPRTPTGKLDRLKLETEIDTYLG